MQVPFYLDMTEMEYDRLFGSMDVLDRPLAEMQLAQFMTDTGLSSEEIVELSVSYNIEENALTTNIISQPKKPIEYLMMKITVKD